MKPLRFLAAATIAALSFPVHAVGHLADVNIVDRATGRGLPVTWKDGRAYVVGRPGAEYQVTVRNRHGEEILAVVSVDGLNVMTGETANPRQSGYVLSQWGRADVSGWRKSLDEVAAFYFTSLGDSYATRTDRPANVGVIGVALFRRKDPWPESGAVPLDAERLKSESSNEARRDSRSSESPRVMAPPPPSAPAPAQAQSEPLGTGHGRREESRIRWVDFERATQEPAETIAIYYDSYRNLVAQGVLKARPAPRDPNPFPTAFAPDPWR
jgi:hypothetical protein